MKIASLALAAASALSIAGYAQAAPHGFGGHMGGFHGGAPHFAGGAGFRGGAMGPARGRGFMGAAPAVGATNFARGAMAPGAGFTPRPGLAGVGRTWRGAGYGYGYGRHWRRGWGYGAAALGLGLGYGWGWPGYDYAWGYGYPYGYGYDYAYDYPTVGYVTTGALGDYCTTPVKTCQLYEPAQIGIGCSCRIPGGRARGVVR